MAAVCTAGQRRAARGGSLVCVPGSQALEFQSDGGPRGSRPSPSVPSPNAGLAPCLCRAGLRPQKRGCLMAGSSAGVLSSPAR